jgi:hypothetical protein
MAIWCIALTIYLAGCRTNPVPVPPEAIKLDPPLPPVPVMEPVVFEDRDGGLWLSYEQYRALERNIIALREHTARLEIIIGFYREE